MLELYKLLKQVIPKQIYRVNPSLVNIHIQDNPWNLEIMALTHGFVLGLHKHSLPFPSFCH
jgi:hypothetical protein